MKTNPFRMAERVGNVIGVAAFVVLAIASFGIVGWAVSSHYGWGWWGLLLIPGVPVALIILAILAGLIRLLCDTIHDRWLMAKWRWDDRHPPRTESTEPDGAEIVGDVEYDSIRDRWRPTPKPTEQERER